jgi:hypothetical protein
MKTIINLFFLITAVFFLNGCASNDEDKKPVANPPATEEDDGDPDIGVLTAPGIFYDKFSTALDNNKWEALNQVWGQPANVAYQHGGVISENVSTKIGYAVLLSLGDQYTGPARGENGFSKRLGAVIKTKQRFASGRFEVKMKVVQASNVGVLSTAWLFWYKEISHEANPVPYDKAIAAGNIPNNDGSVILNHEIDIEVKGVNLGSTIYTNWIGEKNGEFDSQEGEIKKDLYDNAFHVYRFDWHTGGNNETPRVEYYIDNVLVHTSTTTVPYIAAYFNVGNWFAWWAGNDTGTYVPPAYDTKQMLVDWVKITPFNEPNDDWLE